MLTGFDLDRRRTGPVGLRQELIAALDAHALHAAEIFLPGTRHPDRVSVRLGP